MQKTQLLFLSFKISKLRKLVKRKIYFSISKEYYIAVKKLLNNDKVAS